MPDDAYDPACIRLLAGMEPRPRPAGFVEVEDDIERRPMGVHDALEAWAEGRLSVERALQLTGAADVAEMIVLCHVNEVSRPLLGGPVTRVALRAEDLSDREMALTMASEPVGAGYSLDDIPDEED